MLVLVVTRLTTRVVEVWSSPLLGVVVSATTVIEINMTDSSSPLAMKEEERGKGAVNSS